MLNHFHEPIPSCPTGRLPPSSPLNTCYPLSSWLNLIKDDLSQIGLEGVPGKSQSSPAQFRPAQPGDWVKRASSHRRGRTRLYPFPLGTADSHWLTLSKQER